jgi:DNA-binding response OmpR family regulator
MAASATLHLLERPLLREHRIQYSDALHLLIIDETAIPCTPTEYSLLQALLQHAGEGVPINHLLGRPTKQAVKLHTRRTLTQHISRLRARLWPFGLDILCLNGYGYLLLPRSHEQATGT